MESSPMCLADEVLTLNRKRSEEFISIAVADKLARWNVIYPTKILVFKCMDGRVNLPLITGVPLGKLHPFRNIGGKFNLGDPYLKRLVLDARDDALRTGGRHMLALCTYHFSSGNEHRGCAGHKYDTQSAIQGAFKLKGEFGVMFGERSEVVSAIVLGIETDEDALVFWNGEDKSLSIASCTHFSDDTLLQELVSLYPDLPAQVMHDLLPLAIGNRDHVLRLRKQQTRQIAELVHNENIIGVGRGFDWLHLPNRALIIGPYGNVDSTWREAITVAGSIVCGNFKRDEQLRLGGALLLVSAPYKQSSRDKGAATLSAQYFAAVAEQMLRPVRDELNLKTLVGITNMDTMLYEPL